MTTVYEVPLSGQPQLLFVPFPSGVTYQLRLIYMFTPNDEWELDINDAIGNPIVCGIPLVSGADLLAQYDYLNFGCSMFVTVDGDLYASPKFWNLGKTAHLFLSA